MKLFPSIPVLCVTAALLCALCAGEPSAKAQVFLTAPSDVAKLRIKESAPAVRAPTFAPFVYPGTAKPEPQFQPERVTQLQPAARPSAAAPAPAGALKSQIPGLPASAPAQRSPAAPAAPQADSSASRAASASALGAGTVLRHLTNNVQGFRLTGEIGASEWPMYVTDAQARRKLQFQIGYIAAVSVMPEASTMTLMINDEIVGETPIRAVAAVKTVVFDIPQNLLRPGFNSIRISTDQRHRVDCSIDATYELWTQIDPTQTGLILNEADASIDNLADLGALLPDEQGALPIRAVLPRNPQPATVARVSRAAQLISIIGRFEQPVIDAGAPAGGRYGVNLVVGVGREVSDALGPNVLSYIDRPRAVVLPATVDRRTTIVITGATPAQVDDALKLFIVGKTLKGAPAGIRAAAAFPGYRVEGGQQVKLRDLGLVSEEFSGRLFRAAFNIVMPSDFYPADYGRASVSVAGGYAPGLTSRAQLMMKINDRTAVSFGLLKSSGDVFRDNPLPLPLGFLRPGLNRIEIEAQVPTKSDESCDPLASINASNRFLFLDQTEIRIPAIARVGRMPDLAVTATGGFPYAGAARKPKLYLPSFDEKSIGAALTVAAHLGVVAGAPLNFEVTTTPPGKGQGPTLAVGPFESIDPSIMRQLMMPISDLREVWKTKINAPAQPRQDSEVLTPREAAARNRELLQANFPMACHVPSSREAKRSIGGRVRFADIDFNSVASVLDLASAASPESKDDAGAGPSSRDLFEEWDAKMHADKSVSNVVRAWFMRTREWGVSKFTDAGSWMRKGLEQSETEERLVTADVLLALAQNILGDSSEDVWTVVTGPNSDYLSQAVSCLVDPRVSRQIAGRLSMLDILQARMNVAYTETPRFVATQPPSIGNIRLIAAGWLSLHALVYVLSALSIAAVLALSTRIFVRNVGRKTD
jgi:cellulose synthase operon protein B